MDRRETTREETNALALLALTSVGCTDVARGCNAMITAINVGDWTIGQLHTLAAVDAAWRHREILRATLDHAEQLLERLQDAAERHAIESEGREILRWEDGQPVFEMVPACDVEVE